MDCLGNALGNNWKKTLGVISFSQDAIAPFVGVGDPPLNFLTFGCFLVERRTRPKNTIIFICPCSLVSRCRFFKNISFFSTAKLGGRWSLVDLCAYFSELVELLLLMVPTSWHSHRTALMVKRVSAVSACRFTRDGIWAKYSDQTAESSPLGGGWLRDFHPPLLQMAIVPFWQQNIHGEFSSAFQTFAQQLEPGHYLKHQEMQNK